LLISPIDKVIGPAVHRIVIFDVEFLTSGNASPGKGYRVAPDRGFLWRDSIALGSGKISRLVQ
jgi:hypothetical protein